LSAGHVWVARQGAIQTFEQRCRGVGSAHFDSNEIGGGLVRKWAATIRRRRRYVSPARCCGPGFRPVAFCNTRLGSVRGRSKVAQAFCQAPATAGFFPNFLYWPQRQEVATLREAFFVGNASRSSRRWICPGRDSRGGPGSLERRLSNRCASRRPSERSAVLLRSAKATG
jgi:hypothetical protein